MPKFIDQDVKAFYEYLVADTEILPHKSTNQLDELVVHVSEGCNLSCSYCFADRGQYGASGFRWMSADRAREIVRAAVRNYRRVGSVKFFGGEPFMNLVAIEATIDEFRVLVADGQIDREPEYVAISNMTVITPQVLKLVKDSQMRVTGSIDGPQEVNDEFRRYSNGKGSFEDIDAGIRLLRLVTGQPQSLEVVFGPQHLRRGLTAVDMHKFLTQKYGIEAIVIHPMVPESGVAKEEDWEEFNKQVRGMFESYGEYLVQRISEGGSALLLVHALKAIRAKRRKDIHCSLGVDTLTATANGQIYPCYTLIGRNEMVMANGIVNWSKEATEFVAVEELFTRIKKSEIPVCAVCDIAMSCRACPGSMVHVNESLTQPVDAHCLHLIGYTEGVLKGLKGAKEDEEVWAVVSVAMAKAASSLREKTYC